ncbi:hypothetical protein QRX50_24405 [Amycolatopsis carbonis]|uniref:Uncharacterized protein n=1 Tax=Amycolatopsis carbonis TaxID=715471 RepID=A0A9Y2IQQ1_9PSEU|nr:hypothetical protein [Amycolatopsis sp. 2-15]WIX83671.1 hypothetical protein QRX50_24405 [Amycolatopsis sp. 2-15]
MIDSFTGRQTAAIGGCGDTGEEPATDAAHRAAEDDGFEMFIRAWLELLDTVRS